MFVYERVDKQDKELFEKVSGRWYDERYSQWRVDRDNGIFIVCIGKHGVETPVVFYMLYKNFRFKFYIPEPDILYGNKPTVYVKLPEILYQERAVIETTIKRAFCETSEEENYGSLPRTIDDHIFDIQIATINSNLSAEQ